MKEKPIKKALSYFFGRHPIEIAIFSASPEELKFIREKFATCKFSTVQVARFEFELFEYKRKKILLACTGMGTTFAASVLSLIHQKFSPKYVFLLGSAGGIKQGLKICDVVIVNSAFEAEIQGVFTALKGTAFEDFLTHPLKNQCFPALYNADLDLLKLASTVVSQNVFLGTAVSSNAFPSPRELFMNIKNKNVYSIDMETSAFYQVAWLLGIKTLAVRGISNVLNADGSDDGLHDIAGSMLAASNVLWKIVNHLLFSINPDLEKPEQNNPKQLLQSML